MNQGVTARLALDERLKNRVALLGILAGGGPLPTQVARAAQAAGRRVFLVGFEGFADKALLASFSYEMIRLGAAGAILAALRREGVQDLVLIGPVRRPSMLDLRPDAEGMKIVGRIGRAAFSGDDGLLAFHLHPDVAGLGDDDRDVHEERIAFEPGTQLEGQTINDVYG